MNDPLIIKGSYGFTFEFRLIGHQFTFLRYADGDRMTAILHRIHLNLYPDVESKRNAVAKWLTTYAGANIKVIRRAKSLIDPMP